MDLGISLIVVYSRGNNLFVRLVTDENVYTIHVNIISMNIPFPPCARSLHIPDLASIHSSQPDTTQLTEPKQRSSLNLLLL